MNLTINTKINAAIVLILALLLTASMTGFYAANQFSSMLQFVTGPAWEAADGTMEGTIGVQRQIIEIDRLVRTSEQHQVASKFQQMRQAQAFTVEALESMRQSGLMEPRMINKLDGMLSNFDTAVQRVLTIAEQNGLSDRNNLLQATKQVYSSSHELLEFLVELEEVADGKVEGQTGHIKSMTSFIYTLLASVTFVALLLAVVGSIVGRSQIATPIRNVANHFYHIATVDGDLTVKLPVRGKDEIARLSDSFNAFVGKIQATMKATMEVTAQLADTAGEMAHITLENRNAVNHQQQETSMVATAVNEMSASINEVARNAVVASTSVNSADEQVNQGKQIVHHTQQRISLLSDEVTKSADVINQLRDESDNIGSVLDVIRGIAEQTNLLALNAAIEAARAGEQGRGFAVVADEVRTLAKRTQQSTDEIQDMIQRLQSGTAQAVESMTSSRDLSNDTVTQAKESEKALQSIATIIGTIRDMNFQVSTATEQQSTVSEEINKYIININQSVEELNTSSHKTSDTSELLAGLSQELQTLVSQFRV